MYYSLFTSEAAARAAAAEMLAAVRLDWESSTSAVKALRADAVAPCHHDGGVSTVKLAGGVPVFGFVVETSGDFARSGEDYRGKHRCLHGYAWQQA